MILKSSDFSYPQNIYNVTPAHIEDTMQRIRYRQNNISTQYKS